MRIIALPGLAGTAPISDTEHLHIVTTPSNAGDSPSAIAAVKSDGKTNASETPGSDA